MKNQKRTVILIAALLLIAIMAAAQDVAPEASVDSTIINDNSDKLVVVWTSADRDVAEKMVFMYTNAAKKAGWFKDVTIIVWGPSAKLLSEDVALQEYMKKMQDAGVNTQACIACAGMYGVVDKLKSLGIEVKGMGGPLSDYLKEGRKVITF
jgi:hypothetical protein